MDNGSFTGLSLIFLTVSLYSYKKTSMSKVSMGVFYVMTYGSALLFTTYGVINYFTGHGLDEATIYHLEYGLEGAGFLEYDFLIIATIIIMILNAVLLLWYILKFKNSGHTRILSILLLYSFLLVSLLLNPASINIYNLYVGSLSSVEQLDPEVQASFYKYYRKPNIKETENVHKNIVFIYAESLERTYFDKTLFPGLINGLRELEADSTYFTNIKQVDNTGWTLAGMTASQCGIPLVTPSHGNSMSGMDKFLSSAVCLGDLLNDSEYQLNYMGGASLDFAGKGKLYKTHGFTNVIGRDKLLTKLENENYQSGWGLYDDSLLEMGYNRFVELSEAGGKFGLFMLTLDTHHPNGHPSKSCKGTEYKDASNEILNAVACSDYLISNFIKRITTSKYAGNTLIVLMSDHLAMRNTASDLLQSKERSNLFMIIDPDKDGFKEISTVGSTLDVGATLLPFLGYRGDIGLGRNLLDDKFIEKDRLFVHSNLKKWRQSIGSFWDFPKIQNAFEVSIDEKYVSIDGRKFGFPIFIELNRDLESTLKFQFDKSPGHKSLVQHRKELNNNTYFILIDECANARELDELLDESGFCIIAGKGSKYTTIAKLGKNVTYTPEEIRKLLGLKK